MCEEMNVLYPVISTLLLIIVVFGPFIGFSGQDERCSEECGESHPAVMLYGFISDLHCNMLHLQTLPTHVGWAFLYISMFTIIIIIIKKKPK